MSTRNWRRLLIVGVLACGLVVGVLLSGCSSGPQLEPKKTYEQIWIEAHPTHAGPNGECVERDDEPCDDDPFDLDDLKEAKVKTYKGATPTPVVKPRPSAAVKPLPTKGR